MGKPETEFCDDFYWSQRQKILDRTRAEFPAPKYFRPVTMTKEIIEAMEVVVKYEWYSEMEDYLSSEEEYQENHVFVSKLLLRDWLEAQPDFWIETGIALTCGVAIFGFLVFLPEIILLVQQIVPGW